MVPSLDAVSEKAFVRINRPDKKIDVRKIEEGIRVFTKEFKGRVWLEVFIVPGLNDSRPDLLLLKEAIHRIHPDRVQINTLDRPGTLPDIRPASGEELENIIQILAFPNTEIIARTDSSVRAQRQSGDVKAAIIETIHRRPCTKQDLLQILGVDAQKMDACIKSLEQEGKIVAKSQERGIFYQTLKE